MFSCKLPENMWTFLEIFRALYIRLSIFILKLKHNYKFPKYNIIIIIDLKSHYRMRVYKISKCELKSKKYTTKCQKIPETKITSIL